MVTAVTLPFLTELVALFTVSVGIAYLCYRFKIVPIVGFLIAGVVIGPNALGLVQDQELVDMLAEIGIILLLFTIGIEFSLELQNKKGHIFRRWTSGGFYDRNCSSNFIFLGDQLEFGYLYGLPGSPQQYRYNFGLAKRRG